MGPTRYLPAYCCARKGCNGYRFVHAAVDKAEDLVCTVCGDAFPEQPWMLPEPRRPPRDAAARGPGGGAGGGSSGANKGKGKGGKGDRAPKGRGKGDKGKGGTDSYAEEYPALPRAAAKAQAKAKPSYAAAASSAPWATAAAAPRPIKVDPRRKKTDPTYGAVLKVVLAKQLGDPTDIAQAEEELERERPKHEASLPPERRRD